MTWLIVLRLTGLDPVGVRTLDRSGVLDPGLNRLSRLHRT